MSTTHPYGEAPAPTAPRERSPLIRWFAVGAVTTGIFAIVTAEILPIGLLTPVASTFAVSEGTAGLMMTLPGIVAALAAPLVTVTTRRLDRRRLLCLLIAVLTMSDAVCALAPTFGVVLAARVLVGLVIGGFWSIGAGLAGRLVEERHVTRATAVIFSAVPLGSVLGVPAGTVIGQIAGWEAAFVALAVLSAAVLAALAASLPPLPARDVTDLAALRGLLRRRSAAVGVLVTVLVVLAHFGTYTYVTPFLFAVTRLGPAAVSTLLLVYGAAGVVGNFVAGATIAAHLRATWAVAAGLIATATLLLPVVGTSALGVTVLLVAWGLAYGAVPVCSQTWIARRAAAPEAATVLFTSSFQATISLGALLGGLLLDATSVVPVMLAGGAVAVGAVAVLVVRPYRREAAEGSVEVGRS